MRDGQKWFTPKLHALASSGTATTSDLTLPELYRHASAWSQFHTNLHLSLGKHGKCPCVGVRAPSRGTLPQQCLSLTFRTLIRPADPLEVNNLLYFPRVIPIRLLTWHTGRSSYGCARMITMRNLFVLGCECRRRPRPSNPGVVDLSSLLVDSMLLCSGVWPILNFSFSFCNLSHAQISLNC